METTIKTHTVKGEPMHIHIRLSDPCKNGHNDFAITADIWSKTAKRLTDNNIDRCGCCHEDIVKKMPSLQLFVDLHLSDESGAPVYAVENGYYHMRNSSTQIFAHYMRISTDHASRIITTIHNKEDFSKWVETLRPSWAAQANEAKAKLAELIDKNMVPTQ